ncbi:MAG: serine hydrolase [Gammaproteobacteria bacterium]|jgi:CubicO group peptidase (beta-lactamase class C family)/peptidoglycan/xylan/chitin deacetylase (PgdA/CDA1 family)
MKWQSIARPIRWLLFAVPWLVPAGSVMASPTLQGVEVALSFDDLPWVGADPVDGTITDAVNRIAAVLNAHNAPAIGFVICNRYRQLKAPVKAWAAWGYDIGNHSSSHMDLNSTKTSVWLQDVKRCDEQLRGFPTYHGLFRFPMLHQGDTRAKRDAVASALSEMNLRTGHVTVDTSDWILTQYHARAIRQKNAVLRRQVGEAFIRHILAAVRHADAVSRRKLGRQMPQVLLLHANSLVDDYLDELLLALHRNGARFVPIEKALSDTAYQREDDYVGKKGISWRYRMQPASPEDADWGDAQAQYIRDSLDAEFSKHGKGVARTTISSMPVGDRGNAKLMALLERAGSSERWRSLIIYRHGKIQLEAYFNGVNETTPQNLKSVTKSVTALLLGKALDAGWIQQIDDPVANYLPAYKRIMPQQPIRIAGLLTMSTGLVPVPYAKIQQQDDWVKSVLKAGVSPERRGKFNYDTPVLELLSASLESASGEPSIALANHYLLGGTAEKIDYWRRDPRGIDFGGNDAFLTPRGMLDIGKLVLGKGVLNGHRVLNANFVDQATRAQIMPASDTVNHGTLPVDGYGYLWWLTRIGGQKAIAALGHGGQMIFVVPSRDSVVVVTSRWPMHSSVRHYRHVTRMLNEDFLPMFWKD